MNKLSVIKCLLLLLLSAFSFASFANSNNDLVSVKAWIGSENESQSEAYAVTQQVLLTIDISTSHWFVGSTKIGNISLPNLIAKRRNLLATNYTDTVNGETRVHQRWEITLYPQASGNFVIPPIPVSVVVAGNVGQKISKQVLTPKMAFSARLPDASLTSKQPWFSAADARINQSWSMTQDELKVGDAITRTITIDADNSLSILLPQVLHQTPTQQYQAYSEPVQLNDQSSRGDYISSRTDKVVYIMQQGGDVTFPAIDVKWWNTEQQKVETVHLEARTFHIRHTLQSFVKAYWQWGAAIVLLLLLVVIIVWLVRKYFQTHPVPLSVTFWQAIQRGDIKAARLLLYTKLLREKHRYAFQQTQDLADIGPNVAQSNDSKTFKQSWKRIKAEKSANSLLKPMKLADKIKSISE